MPDDHGRRRRRLLTTAEAAQALDVTAAALRKWRQRGQAKPRAGTERHPLWDLADLVEVTRDQRDRRNTERHMR